MFDYQNYKNSINKLTKSLVIKLQDTAYLMNKGIAYNDNRFVTPEDKRQWKYYLNLAGIKHDTNSKDIKVLSLDTGEYIDVTKLNLENNLSTKNELLQFSEYYNRLIEKYPDDELYIRGCLLPVDLKTAINAEEGTILNYLTTEVEENEYTLIPKLEKFIKNFIHRYNVREYAIVDKYYYPIFLANLYIAIPNKLINLRNNNIGTNLVNTFHLKKFFQSHNLLWDNVKDFKPDTIQWLYKNMSYIEKNIGKNKTLELLNKKFFEPNSVGVGKYNIKRQLPSELDKDVLYQAPFNSDNVILYTEALNDSYKPYEKDNIEVDGVIEKLIKTTNADEMEIYKNNYEFLIDKEKEEIKKKPVIKEITKVIDIAPIETYNPSGTNTIELIIYYWIYNVKMNKLKMTVDYQDANTLQATSGVNDISEFYITEFFNINHRVGLLFLLKILLKISNQLDIKITKVYFNNIIDTTDIVIDELIDSLFLVDDNLKEFYTETYKNLPVSLTSYLDIDSFNNYITSIIRYNEYNWKVDVNSENVVTHANFKAFNNLLTSDGEYILSNKEGGETIDEILEREGYKYTLPSSFNLMESLKGIIKAFSGVNLEGELNIKQSIENAKTIIKKLTSYTTTVISEGVGEEPYHLTFNHNTVLSSEKAVMAINEIEYRVTEEDEAYLRGYSRGGMDNIYSINLPEIPRIYMDRPIHGNAYIETSENRIVGIDLCKPTFRVTVKDKPLVVNSTGLNDSYDSSNPYSWKTVISLTNIEAIPIEYDKVRLSSHAIGGMDNIYSINLPAKPKIWPQRGLYGNGYLETPFIEVVEVDKPTFKVSVKNTPVGAIEV